MRRPGVEGAGTILLHLGRGPCLPRDSLSIVYLGPLI